MWKQPLQSIDYSQVELQKLQRTDYRLTREYRRIHGGCHQNGKRIPPRRATHRVCTR